ncbi:L-asparaginase [Litoreibacter ascidiaceicola]|uniref:L-asparaginase n=1 Tax=Litoreibacter ascidiaceicola TaxID=1486859 RepID=A0A1M4ZWM0_9RHOB|nr:asparaginase domain-containing protein [Litoreibacter ascidiaceicola]SHF22418.1 L-asparaginase [Litoreibacter ascidiaceicola]
MKDVRIIVTGGTIDKVHDPATEALAFSEDNTTHVPEILSLARCHFPTVQLLMLKDSLDFDDDDRATIVEAILAAPEPAIVVTHGTGTMGQSARWISKRVSGKTIVLTGAMRPHSLSFSDGPFNMGGAIIAAQVMQNGVYGVMNGRVFEAAALTKNTEQGRFDV